MLAAFALSLQLGKLSQLGAAGEVLRRGLVTISGPCFLAAGPCPETSEHFGTLWMHHVLLISKIAGVGTLIPSLVFEIVAVWSSAIVASLCVCVSTRLQVRSGGFLDGRKCAFLRTLACRGCVWGFFKHW